MNLEAIAAWIGFTLFVLAMLALDLGVFHREAREVSYREAVVWSAVWISCALAFNAVVYLWRGQDVALQFLTGYLIEKSLSVDNIFVFVLIFSAFAVPIAYQQRVLFWGVIGAIVMRAALIIVGTELIAVFHWVLYLFGGFLVITGIRMAFHGQGEIHPDRNPVVRVARRVVPVTEGYEGPRFFVRRQGTLWVTPLLIVLLIIESTDLIFALDSIPAIFAITLDPFIVFSSNVFAIMGLRALYFLVGGSVQRFAYLKYGLAAVLGFVGLKMLVAGVYEIPVVMSLVVIVALLAASVAASLLVTATPGRAGAK
jgi:tellurite resistance protein TerC